MNKILDTANRIIVEDTGNPYLRFILKKNVIQLTPKAYKKFKVEVYLHSPENNIKCLDIEETINTSGKEESKVWDMMIPYVYFEIVEWLMSDKYKKIRDEYKLE